MTIKRSLFWSNIMMLVIPVVLSIVISYIILFIFTGKSDEPMERAFPRAFNIIWDFQRTGDKDVLLENIREFNDQFPDNTVYMAVLSGDRFLFPEDAPQVLSRNRSALNTFLEDGVTGSIVINQKRFVIEQSGAYRIVLADQKYRESHRSPRPMTADLVVLLVIMVAVILVTNRMLTYMVTRRITVSLTCLADGAHQLRDGNLAYRIRYKGKDEFAPVCDDFNEMAEQLQKLVLGQQRNEESNKELLASISHDLRTPLTSIKAYVEGLLDGVAEDYRTQLRYLNIIRSKAEDIDHIVDQLFLYSKLNIGEFPFYNERLDIGGELEAMVSTVAEEYISRDLTVILLENLKDVHVWADPVQLRRALVNILENSVKYKEKEHCTVRLRCFEEEGRVTIWLTDDGPGVSEEKLDKLFQVFYRSDPSRQNPSKGSGLGLAITAKIMSRMSGSALAENAPEGGLRIILRLPKPTGEGTSS